ncbi:hypothetical protein [Acetonema longum]|uniref:Uncharacterized protein n=1 Tax=Acetonema longum DSM 6540 TaxID=1009370 RepID=F7NGW4_9FIRM|nr:hypothetical protein [Acetonema longum]EGO64695.1 hypothetical protein ALO_06528 [Acetonema longum DSM 6540]
MGRRYTKIGMLEKEIDEMIAQGKSHREIEKYYGWKEIDPYTIF